MSPMRTVGQAIRRATPAWIKRLAKSAPGLQKGAQQPVPPLDTPEIAALRSEVNSLTWFHSIDLGNGIVTPGREHTPTKLARLGFPEDLTGRTVLDVGAWNGFFSFEAERRGASRVLATDYFSWGGEDGYGLPGADGKATFDLAHRVLRSRVEARRIDIFDLSPETVGRFDLVLFLGVLYHMRHPFLALERVASVAADMIILETHVDMLDCPRPAMAFYATNELAGDPTNWCGPNPPMVEAMLRTVGFRKVQAYGDVYPCRISPRVTFHAWK
ncbi:MAG TPA: class I SAM-dependent methyltransferase [Gemmataceae bacterium]|nr:class I SAM-dependent methyltransferase [Gemmataceae bacterium]